MRASLALPEKIQPLSHHPMKLLGWMLTLNPAPRPEDVITGEEEKKIDEPMAQVVPPIVEKEVTVQAPVPPSVDKKTEEKALEPKENMSQKAVEKMADKKEKVAADQDVTGKSDGSSSPSRPSKKGKLKKLMPPLKPIDETSRLLLMIFVLLEIWMKKFCQTPEKHFLCFLKDLALTDQPLTKRFIDPNWHSLGQAHTKEKGLLYRQILDNGTGHILLSNSLLQGSHL